MNVSPNNVHGIWKDKSRRLLLDQSVMVEIQTFHEKPLDMNSGKFEKRNKCLVEFSVYY